MAQIMFSIVVPVYNVEKYLAECLNSVLNQSFTDFELLIIDDMSTDSSLQIARQYAEENPDRIRLIEHPVNKGLGGARNTGIEAATGQYLLFLDSDDFMKPGTLEVLHSTILAENADIVEFGYDYVDETGAFLYQEHCPKSVYSSDGKERSLLTRGVTAWNKAVRATAFTDTGIRYPEKRYYEDFWTTPKLWMLGIKAVTLDLPLYGYRQRAGSIMHDTNVSKAEDILLGADQLLDFCRQSNFPQERWNELEYLILRHLLNAVTRVNGIDPRSAMQNKIWDYWMTHFPNYAENPYLELMDDLHKELFRLVTTKKFLTLYVTFHIRARIVRVVKRILR